MALCTWSEKLRYRDVLIFVDNEPAKDALIHGISDSPASSRLVRFTRIFCARLALGAWYERVASPSNIGDAPSRGRFSELLAAGAREVSPVAPVLDDVISLRPF